MAEPADKAAYIRTQAVAAGVINAMVNPALEWLVNPTRGFQPFFGPAGVAANLALTSVILALLVALIASRVARRRFAVPARRSVLLGTGVGLAAAAVVVAVLWALDRTGLAGLSFAGFLVVRAVYCGLLGYVVAWLILTRLLRP